MSWLSSSCSGTIALTPAVAATAAHNRAAEMMLLPVQIHQTTGRVHDPPMEETARMNKDKRESPTCPICHVPVGISVCSRCEYVALFMPPTVDGPQGSGAP
jgi:hypothetical protein